MKGFIDAFERGEKDNPYEPEDACHIFYENGYTDGTLHYVVTNEEK
jgi:hypothetical protein